MEDLVIKSSTHVRRVQWTTREMRVALGEPGTKVRWYAYRDVPWRVFDDLRAQERGALSVPTVFPKGGKPYSVGTYFHAKIEHKFGQRSVEGPLL